MTEAIWYFADGDEERGPVTEAQVRALIGTGNLKPDDLVWKEGMEDWAPAEEIPGLFDSEPPAPPLEPPPPNDAATGDETVPEERTPEEEPADEPSVSKVIRPRRPLPSLDISKPLEAFQFASFLGQPLFLAGLLLVLLARGCDSLGHRQVARRTAKARVAEAQFQDGWDRDRNAIDSRRKELEEKTNQTVEDRRDLDALVDELQQLNRDKQKELEELRRGKWQSMTAAARDAEANNDMWGFWREGFFWLGTFVFVLGLAVIGFTDKSTERRWICLIILAVVVYALYVGRG